MVGILTALPQTQLWRRMEREGRLVADYSGDQFGRTNFVTRLAEKELLEGTRGSWGICTTPMHTLPLPSDASPAARAQTEHVQERRVALARDVAPGGVADGALCSVSRRVLAAPWPSPSVHSAAAASRRGTSRQRRARDPVHSRRRPAPARVRGREDRLGSASAPGGSGASRRRRPRSRRVQGRNSGGSAVSGPSRSRQAGTGRLVGAIRRVLSPPWRFLATSLRDIASTWSPCSRTQT